MANRKRYRGWHAAGIHGRSEPFPLRQAQGEQRGNHRSPFDKLRANGGKIAVPPSTSSGRTAGKSPFALSLSKGLNPSKGNLNSM